MNRTVQWQRVSAERAEHLAEVLLSNAAEAQRMLRRWEKETHDKLRRVQDLMRHRVPNGDPAVIFDRALTLLQLELDRTKLAAVKRPRNTAATSTASRHVPAAIKRAVWTRDAGRCAFVGRLGRCSETGFLEFHHIVPYAAGGETSAGNLELRCRAHNAYEAEKYFGPGSSFVRERRGGAWMRLQHVFGADVAHSAWKTTGPLRRMPVFVDSEPRTRTPRRSCWRRS